MIGLAGANPSAVRIADSIEAALLFGPDASISKASLADQLEEDGTLGALEEFDELHDEDAEAPSGGHGYDADLRARAREGLAIESRRAEDVLLHLEWRAQSVGANYPLEVSGLNVRRKYGSWQDHLPYAFMVALNARVAAKLAGDTNVPARLFERMVVLALKAHWAGEAEHFGWPRNSTDAGPFPAALANLITKIGERLSVRVDQLPTRLKDLEVDAVAWRPLDSRRGQTVLLCQCAIGDNWQEKGIHLDQWTTVVRFAVHPLKATAFPFLPDFDSEFANLEWELLCAKLGLPLDRIRLAALVPPHDLPDHLREQIIAWTEVMAPNVAQAAS